MICRDVINRIRLFLFVGLWGSSVVHAQVPAYYYQGDTKVAVEVRTDVLSLETTTPLSAKDRGRIGAAVPTRSMRPAGSDKRLVVETGAASLPELKSRAQELRAAAPGAKVRPVLQPKDDSDESAGQVLTEQISFQVEKGEAAGKVATLAKKYGMTEVKPVAGIAGAYTATINGDTTDLMAPLTAANRMQESGEVMWAAPLVLKKQSPRVIPNDPFFPNQWHLQNNGSNTTEGVVGVDLNVVPAWAHATGAGINIAITDDGLETSHPDLLANVRTDLNYDFNDADNDPTPLTYEGHGTSCAGVTAGKGNNGIGISGVAPDGGLAGLRLISDFETDFVEAQAMTWKMDEANEVNQVAVNSNSWGPTDSGTLVSGPGPLTDAALEAGATQGRNGKGIIYSWAAGNGRNGNDNINRDGYANSPFVIAVGATNSQGTFSWYSEPGAPMLVNAPSNHASDGIFTTDLMGWAGQNPTDYRNNFGGTSSAAPAVAGVIALMLEANPALTYRDVMHILVDTSVKNDPVSSSWAANGSGRLFSHNYGYGRVNAGNAVLAALGWQNVPAAAAPIEVTDVLTSSVAIPDANTTGIEFQIPVDHNTPFFTEHVELQADVTHGRRGQLRFRLISPSGMVSELLPANLSDTGANFSNWSFRSVAHWGESPVGTWKVQIADVGLQYAGKVNSLALRIRGYEAPPASVSDWGMYE